MTANDLMGMAFEVLSDAPDGLRRLRELVLQLAVRGKLVQQDPAEGSAREYLRRVEQQKLAAGGTKSRRHAGTIQDAAPWDLPQGWLWAEFGDTHFNRDAEREPVSSELRESRKGPYDYYGASGAIDKIDDFLFDKPLLLIGEDGANLVLRSTPIAFIARGKYWVNNHAHVLDGLDELSLRYLAIFVNSIDLRPFLTGMAQPKLNQARMNIIPCAVPPLAEQHRIVARVDELMGLLDRLEAARSARDDLRRATRDAAIAALRDAEDADAVEVAWGRIAKHMDALFADPADVSPLRQAVLGLAVRGRLVVQDPGDEPASLLLERISKEKLRLRANDKSRGTITAAEPPLLWLPPSWCWSTLGSVLSEVRNGFSSSPNDQGIGIRVLRISAATSGRDGVVNLSDCKHTDVKYTDITSFLVQTGDLLSCRFNGNLHFVGRAAIVTEEPPSPTIYPDKLIRLKPVFMVSAYLRYAINSSIVRKQIESMAATTAGNIGINGSQLKSWFIPVPPIAEQHRIVAKVDALMALCDALETRLTAARDLHAQFAAAAIHHLDV